MTRTRAVDLPALRAAVPDGVITSAGLRAAGVSNSTTATRCRPGGPWQRILPGVVLLTGAPPTARQRLRAAVAYGGDCVITGVDALRHHGVLLRGFGRTGPDQPAPPDARIHLLVAAHRRLAEREYLVVERTARMPEPVRDDGLPFAPAARAALDAARRQRDPAKLRELLFAPVRAGACTLEQLRDELAAGSQRGSAAPRALLNSAALEVVPLVAARARRLVAAAPLPPPSWHLPLRAASGLPLGVADAWWSEVAMAWDFGGQGKATGPAAGAMAQAGIQVVRTAPDRLREDPDGVIRDLVAAFSRAARRPRPPVYAQLTA